MTGVVSLQSLTVCEVDAGSDEAEDDVVGLLDFSLSLKILASPEHSPYHDKPHYSRSDKRGNQTAKHPIF